MTSNLLTETKIRLNLLAHEQDVALSTCWRWCIRGIRGIRLESFNVGAKKFTTREAFVRWVALTNGESAVAGTTPRQRERDIKQAESELAKAGW